MNPTSNSYKHMVLEMINGAQRIGKGQRWVVELPDKRRCLMKTNLKGNLMTKASSGAVDADLSGFGDDVTDVLVATGPLESLSAWVVPIKLVERLYRDNHKRWLEENPNHSKDNTTWVLTDLKSKFAGYEFELNAKPISPEMARRGLANYFDTTPDKISISVEV